MKTFLTAYWSNLLMFNYEIDPAILQPYVPKGCELDFFKGKCYASLVGFMFLDTKLRGVGFPFHQNFEEVNLRFYIRFNDGNEWKRGVVFIKEIVPRRMISSIANMIYGEKYHCMPMKNSLTENKDFFELKYQWKFNNEWNHLQAMAEKKSSIIEPNSKEEFITEHYWGYSRLNNHTTSEYEVTHPKWQVHKILSYDMKCNIGKLYGTEFMEPLSKQPSSVLLARGSEVSVKSRKVWKY
jgi:uncharacterized protein YqjF (DUF2071 family)